MKKCVKIVLILLLFSGCSSLKQGWKNFTAYYNTFYNTKEFYNEGLQNNLRQVPELNPNVLIRIHPSPSNGGLQEFQQAIERASSILRNHDESRYFLPAIFIIGKSYYYRSEYFSALEKFQELAALADGSLYQEAIIWQGLTYLETSNYSEGIRLLELEVEQIQNWDLEWRAELYAVLAQLHSAQNNYETAIEYLSQSIPFLSDQEKKARGYFLVGQLYENIGHDTSARNAFREISDLRTSYELEYHAKRKEAVVLRRMGNFDLADRRLRQLARDSKFNAYRDELQYEIARTRQLSGNYSDALISYQEVLDDRFQNPGTVVRAKTYYGIAEIYRDYFNDFAAAADYFERAASQRAERSLLPSGFDAAEQAESFGRYAGIKRQLTEKDSLLALASMSDEELKNFIEELQQAEQQRMEQEMRELQRQQSTMAIIEDAETILDVDQASEFGFLNINNRSKLLEASVQFQYRWGDRGLVDNWRRAEAVTMSRFDLVAESNRDVNENDAIAELRQDDSDAAIQAFLELSDIPFSEEEQLSLRKEIENLNYQLANVLFLTLEMPDSAETYYQKVIESDLNRDLVTMSFYSLAELSLYKNDRAQAEEWYFYLELYNPGSIYTAQLADRLGFDQTFDAEELAEPGTPDLYQRLKTNEEEMSPAERAENFVNLANRENSEAMTAMILFDAAAEYMKAAQIQGGRNQTERIRNWLLVRDRFEREQAELNRRKDSSAVMLDDPGLTEDERAYWLAIADSTLSEPDFSRYFPYRGAYWDSTRSVLNRIETRYASASIMPRVQVLSQELRPPGAFDPEYDQPATVFADTEQIAERTDPDPVSQPTTEIVIPETTIDSRRDREQPSNEQTPEQLEGLYTIVLYSFSNENLARTKTAEFIERGFDQQIFICPRVINETEYWRVSLGSFTDITTAIRSTRTLDPPYDAQNFISSINISCIQVH